MYDDVMDTYAEDSETAAPDVGPVSDGTDPLADIEADPSDADADSADGITEESYGGQRTDYDALMAEDLATLKEQFPELATLKDISRLRNPLRYAALRDMGLSAEEAYMASCAPRVRRDSRSHLTSAVPKSSAASGANMSRGELALARDLFSDMSDAELNRLYRRVTG